MLEMSCFMTMVYSDLIRTRSTLLSSPCEGQLHKYLIDSMLTIQILAQTLGKIYRVIFSRIFFEKKKEVHCIEGQRRGRSAF